MRPVLGGLVSINQPFFDDLSRASVAAQPTFSRAVAMKGGLAGHAVFFVVGFGMGFTFCHLHASLDATELPADARIRSVEVR